TGGGGPARVSPARRDLSFTPALRVHRARLPASSRLADSEFLGRCRHGPDPHEAEYFALEGISELLDTVERIRASFNPELTIEGVVLTMLDERTNLAQQVM